MSESHRRQAWPVGLVHRALGYRFGLIVGLFAFLLLTGTAGAATCDAGIVDLRGDWGVARFQVELADDAAERARGLMQRGSLASNAGMLFVYPGPRPVSFWMKDTLIALDMIFADPTGTITRIHENAMPLDETGIPGGDNVQFVLEIKGGTAARLGLAPGDQLRHPAIAPDSAAWPCDAGE